MSAGAQAIGGPAIGPLQLMFAVQSEVGRTPTEVDPIEQRAIAATKSGDSAAYIARFYRNFKSGKYERGKSYDDDQSAQKTEFFCYCSIDKIGIGYWNNFWE